MTAQYITLPIRGYRYVRNGLYPDAAFQNILADRANFAAAYRNRCVFTHGTPIADLPSHPAPSTVTRWRFSFHSSAHAKYLYVHFLVATIDKDPNGSCSVKLTLRQADGTTVGRAEHHYGSITALPETPAFFSTATVPLNDNGTIVEIPADEPLFGTFEDINGARLVGVAVWEVNAHPGLPENHGVTGPIHDEDRADIATVVRGLWTTQAAPLICWTSETDDDAPAVEDAAVNVIDGSASFATSSAGYTLDLRNRRRVSSSTVPCVMYVYASAENVDGEVAIINSSGDVATVEISAGSAAWYSTTVHMPASLAKYDIQVRGSLGNPVTVYAVSLYQHE